MRIPSLPSFLLLLNPELLSTFICRSPRADVDLQAGDIGR